MQQQLQEATPHLLVVLEGTFSEVASEPQAAWDQAARFASAKAVAGGPKIAVAGAGAGASSP